MRKEKSIRMYLKIAMIVFMVIIILPAVNVKADRVTEIEKNNFKKEVILSGYDKKEGYLFCLKGVQGQILKVESSNKSVAEVKKFQYSFHLKPKKLGTTKITITALNGKKKVKRFGTVRIIKFQNPYQVLKVNGKNCKSKLKTSYNMIHIKTKKSNNKLNYKLRPGWEIKYSYTMEQGYDPNRMLKNGQKFNLNIGESVHIFIDVENKKSGLSIGTMLTIQR